jgi:hypothetical protein
MAVAELDKPPNVWCRDLVMGKGCGVYETRPSVCREFYCRWMEDATLGPEWKPSKAKMMLAHIVEHQLSVYVDPGAAGVWRKEPYLSRLVEMAKNGLRNDAIVKVIENGRVMVLLPDRIVDLGVVKADEQIVLRKMPGPGGPTYSVSVARAE